MGADGDGGKNTKQNALHSNNLIHLRNRKHLACFHTVVETQVISHDVIQHWVWSIKLMILEYKSHLIWIRVIIHTTYAKKANKLLGLLRRCTLAFQNPPTRRLLYLSFFSYTSQLWSPQKVELIQEMEKVQRRASKFILNSNYLSEISYAWGIYIIPVSYLLEDSICFFCSKLSMVW